MSKKCFLDRARRDGMAPLSVPNLLSELPKFPQKPRKFLGAVDPNLPAPITVKVLLEGRRADTGHSSTGPGTQLRLRPRPVQHPERKARCMFDEIDYVLEARNVEQFASLYGSYPVEWADGIKLTDETTQIKACLNRRELMSRLEAETKARGTSESEMCDAILDLRSCNYEEGTFELLLLDHGCHVKDNSINVDGGASWLYQGIIDAFQGKIVSSVEDAIAKKTRLEVAIQTIDRKQEVPHDGAMCDLLWSDSEDIVDGWGLSPRGAGFLFGGSVVTSFNHTNNIDYICRAHQLVMEGYKWMFNNQIVTVWSAPNYCYRCGNVAAILELDENLNKQFRVFDAAPKESRGTPAKKPAPDYFL
ncbi:hypothetical protein V6N12_015242 [Hibiscus sabdariffa]|uniref:protein-serine/threonine phosphatase n=1 Tax=Hibiscus sabdariffa TaxID=183260 RepID=A0ABR2DMK0_9ROSI